MNILKLCYNLSTKYLTEYLPNIPELKITNAITYNGRAYKNIKTNIVHTVALSKHNLYISPSFIEEEDVNNIIETICHELAHVLYFDHSEKHKELTESFYKIVNLCLKIDNIDLLAC